MWACAQHAQSAPLGSARARLLRLLRLRARLVALGGSALSCEELSPTTSGARARRLQSRRSHRLRPSRCACPRVVASRCSVVAGRRRVGARRRRVGAGRRRPRRGSGHRASFASRTRRSCTERGTITLRRAGACCTPNPSLTRARARARTRTRARALTLALPLVPTRYVLHFSVWHPGLTPTEVHGITAVHDALRAYEEERLTVST